MISNLCNYRTVVAGAISELCLRLSGRTIEYFAIEWLLVLPLYHLLSGKNELGADVKMDFVIDYPHYNSKLGLLKIQEKAQAHKW